MIRRYPMNLPCSILHNSFIISVQPAITWEIIMRICPNGASRAFLINLKKLKTPLIASNFRMPFDFMRKTFTFGVSSVRKKALSRSNPPFPSSQKLMKEESPLSHSPLPPPSSPTSRLDPIPFPRPHSQHGQTRFRDNPVLQPS